MTQTTRYFEEAKIFIISRNNIINTLRLFLFIRPTQNPVNKVDE
jgi:hypothetical protein